MGDTRRRFEQWAQNPQCEANTLSAVHGIQMRHVAVREGGEATMGQSPFALARGQSFERILFAKDATVLLEELIRQGVLPKGSTGLLDCRLRRQGGKATSLEDAQARTAEALKLAARTPKRSPALIAGATVTIPGGIMLPRATLVLDVLVVRPTRDLTELVVGEIKTYPDRAGYTDSAELALARAQAGVYVHGLELVLADLGLTDKFRIPHEGFLVLSRPGSNQPSVRAGEDLRYQAERARRGFQLLRDAAQALPPLSETHPDDSIEVVAKAETAYDESCMRFCDRAALCRRKAEAAGDGAVLGRDVARFLGHITLPRAVALLGGAKPEDATEADLIRRIGDARVRGGIK